MTTDEDWRNENSGFWGHCTPFYICTWRRCGIIVFAAVPALLYILSDCSMGANGLPQRTGRVTLSLSFAGPLAAGSPLN